MLGHEIVVECKLELGVSISLLLRMLSRITVAFLQCRLPIGINTGCLHGLALCVVVVLSLGEHVREMSPLFLLFGLFELLLVFVEFLFSDLLVDPVGLL